MFFEQLRLSRAPVAERTIENQAQEPVGRDTNRSFGAAGASPENRVAVESKATAPAATLPRDVCHGFLSSQNQTRKVPQTELTHAVIKVNIPMILCFYKL